MPQTNLQSNRVIKKIFWFSFALKLILAACLPIFADEAYYWVWSHHLQLSYYDHPPMVAWLFALGHWLEPVGNAVRFPAVIVGQLTLAVWLAILNDILPDDEKKSGRLVCFSLLVLLSPLIGIGSLIVTPDIPVVFFWSLSIYFLVRLERKPNAFNYLALGASLGLGFCSKYHAVLFVPALLIYLVVEKRLKVIRWRYVPLTIVAGLIFCIPVLYWNYQHDFISFKFQLSHGFSNDRYKPEWTSRYFLGEIALLFPLIFWAALRAKVPKAARFLIYFAWFPFLFFVPSAFKSFVEANWPIIGFPAVFALAIFHPRIKVFTRYYVLIFGAALVVAVATLFVPPLRKLSEHLVQAYEFEQLNKDLRAYRPLYTQTHQWASMLNYISKEPIYKLRGIDRVGFYDFIDESKPAGDHFYLLLRPSEPMPKWLNDDHWQPREIWNSEPPKYKLYEMTKSLTASPEDDQDK